MWALRSGMRERRWPWLVASGLLVAAAVAAAWSTYLHWLPCRGTLLSGSLLRGYRYGSEFSGACLRRMDAGTPFFYPAQPSEQTPWAAELGVVAMALAGTAWLVLALGMKWLLRTKAVAVLPGLATLALAATSAVTIADTQRHVHDSAHGLLFLLSFAPEVTALVALVAIWRWQPPVRGRGFTRVLIVAWGTTAFGIFHLLAEYAFMIAFSDANWDTPPLTGYVTVITLSASAVLTMGLTLRPSPPGSGKEELTHAAHSQQR